MTHYDEATLSASADLVLNSPAFETALRALEDELIAEFQSAPAQGERLVEIKQRMMALESIEDQLKHYIEQYKFDAGESNE